MFRGLVAMTRGDFRPKLVTSLCHALRRTLPRDREKRKNEESDLNGQIA